MANKKWLVFYTKSRQEKKVKEILARNGFEVFLPLQKVMRQWSDRKKKVEVPLFNSYIFVFMTEADIARVLQTPGVSWNIKHNGKPAQLYNNEVDAINRFIESGLTIDTGRTEQLKPLDSVEIVAGALKGLSGKLLRTAKGDRFSMVIESIGQAIIVELDPNVLIKKA